MKALLVYPKCPRDILGISRGLDDFWTRGKLPFLHLGL